MEARAVCWADGVSAGGELVAAAASLVVGLGRRTRDDAVRSLGGLTLTVAGATAALLAQHSCRPCLTRRLEPAVDLSRVKETAAADERNRIARELHDSVSQTLYSIAMVADTLPSALERDLATARTRAQQIRSMTFQALGDIRILLLEMRDSALEAASLGRLLEQLGTNRAGRVVVELDIRGEPDLPPDVKVAGYRIAQEALTNAHRHAAANEVLVRLEQRARSVTLQITDDGTGFDPAAVAPGRHGLQIMHERADHVGAELVVDSEPGRGARVRFRWRDRSGRSTRGGDP